MRELLLTALFLSFFAHLDLEIKMIDKKKYMKTFYISGIYINHLDKCREVFKICFGDLDTMHVPECLITPFIMKIYNKFTNLT